MEDKKFKVIIVEDVKLELKGTEEIFRHEIPNAEVIGTAMTEQEFWTLIEAGVPDQVGDVAVQMAAASELFPSGGDAVLPLSGAVVGGFAVFQEKQFAARFQYPPHLL